MAWTWSSLKTFPLAHLCLAITFFLSGLCINLIQLILYVTINPFSDRLFKKINYYLHYSISARKFLLMEPESVIMAEPVNEVNRSNVLIAICVVFCMLTWYFKISISDGAVFM